MLGKIVRTRRRQLGLTQEALADQTQLSVRSIRDIETQRTTTPRQRTIDLLAEALGLDGADRDQLFASTAPRPEPPSTGSPEPPLPAQLPADLPVFAGRAAQLRQLDTLLGDPPAAMVAAITGPAGVGKTMLAVHWANQVAHRFPDGQLYLDLRGFGPAGSPMHPTEAIRCLIDAFAVPPERLPIGVAAQVGLYRSLLASKRMLVMLDNARDAEQVAPLLPGSPGCVTVVTSRSQLTDLVATGGAQPLSLDLPSDEEAWQLLARRLDAHRVTAEPAAVEQIVTRCGRLPLALAIAAARAATRPRFPLAELARQLREDAHAGLDTLAGRHSAGDLRHAFSWSYHALGSEAARLFRLLGRRPAADVTLPQAARLARAPARRVQRLLAELTHLHLLAEPSPDRYRLHPLLHAYAAEMQSGPTLTVGE
jgi:transcriptional regulator with XRE-family HTH domain